MRKYIQNKTYTNSHITWFCYFPQILQNPEFSPCFTLAAAGRNLITNSVL